MEPTNLEIVNDSLVNMIVRDKKIDRHNQIELDPKLPPIEI